MHNMYIGIDVTKEIEDVIVGKWLGLTTENCSNGMCSIT